MATQTALGIPIPADSDPVAGGGDAMIAMGNYLDPRIRLASGTVTVPVSAAVSGSATVTFPAGRFTQAPDIVACGTGAVAYAWIVSTSGISANGATIGVRNADNTAITASPVVRWIAFQPW